jgi:hypothetical protein
MKPTSALTLLAISLLVAAAAGNTKGVRQQGMTFASNGEAAVLQWRLRLDRGW